MSEPIKIKEYAIKKIYSRIRSTNLPNKRRVISAMLYELDFESMKELAKRLHFPNLGLYKYHYVLWRALLKKYTEIDVKKFEEIVQKLTKKVDSGIGVETIFRTAKILDRKNQYAIDDLLDYLNVTIGKTQNKDENKKNKLYDALQARLRTEESDTTKVDNFEVLRNEKGEIVGDGINILKTSIGMNISKYFKQYSSSTMLEVYPDDTYNFVIYPDIEQLQIVTDVEQMQKAKLEGREEVSQRIKFEDADHDRDTALKVIYTLEQNNLNPSKFKLSMTVWVQALRESKNAIV